MFRSFEWSFPFHWRESSRRAVRILIDSILSACGDDSQQNNQPIELTTTKIIRQKLDYIHTNPVEAGFADYPEAYSYISAKYYDGQKGLLKIQLLDPA